MRNVVFDVESDGFLEELTTIHSLCIKDLDTGELLSCTDDPQGRAMGCRPISEGLEVLANAEKIYGHNIIRFDLPALWKIYPEWGYKGRVFDTLVIASFRYAHIKERDFQDMRRAEKQGKPFNLPKHLIGRHSLEAWGHRLGEHKDEYQKWCKDNGIEEPFAEWRWEMQTYCCQDLDTNEALIVHLRKAGIPKVANDIEHHLAWYLAQQERNGWPFNLERAQELHAELAARKQELGSRMIEQYGSWYKSGGVVTPKRTITYRKNEPCPRTVYEGAQYTKLVLEEFNPSSRQHLAKVLQEHHGWKPTEYTPTGHPKMDEDAILGLHIEGVSDAIVEYLMVDKRLGQLASGNEAWLRHAKTDTPAAKAVGSPMIHHEVMQNKAVTHRAAHKKPNAAQVPAGGSPYGKECRELWYVPEEINGEEWVMLGSDAAGLELRCLAHYMAKWDKGAYAKAILEGDKEQGTDIHSLNRDALRQTKLPPKLAKFAPDLPSLSRDDSKTFIF